MQKRYSLLFLAMIAAALAFNEIPQQGKIVPVRFSHPELVKYDRDKFTVMGKDIFLYSGSFHYFRCDSSLWMDRLIKISDAGFNTVETYIPWNWHEQRKGHPDFTALEKFLTECEQAGLYVIVRPGPYICAEWDVGGFPEWLAGKGAGFRTASPQSISWSQYWYNEVLPVVRRHLISNGGSIIMMQIENEYDYFDLPDSNKAVYLKALYESAIKNEIDVPIITCWTKQVRNHSDSVFSQILDACNFYPGWNIENTIDRIERAKTEETIPMITELQGGWFSSVGEKSVRYVDKFGPDQIDALTKFVMAHGVKALNYYMLYGGTNFGYWGSKGKTTSYDYTAPISESGGLWDKYRSVKLIGDFIRLAGPYLARSHEIQGGAATNSKGVEFLLRADGNIAFLFVWNKNEKPVEAEIAVKLSRTSELSLPVSLGSREAYMLPINLPLPYGKTLYSTNVQVSAVTEFNGKPLIIVYGKPGDEAKIHAGTTISFETIKDIDQLIDWDGVYVLLTSKERAARSQVFQTANGPVALMSGSYLMHQQATADKNLHVSLQTRPGSNSFSLIAPPNLGSVAIDGKVVRTTPVPKTNMLTFSMNTPQLKSANIPISSIKYIPDDELPVPPGTINLKADNGIYPSLDSLGDLENGYTVYSGTVTVTSKKLLKVNYYDNDWHGVYIDGKLFDGLTGDGEENISPTDLSDGSHQIKIVYENEGRPNGSFMEQEKGLKSISCLLPDQVIYLNEWKYSPDAVPRPAVNPAEASQSLDDSKWPEARVGNGVQDFMHENEGRWFRTHIDLTDSALKQNPELVFNGVDENSLVYVNGKLAIEHKGQDTQFKIALENFAAPGDNVIAVYVQNQYGPGGIYKPVVLQLGEATLVKANLQLQGMLNGEVTHCESDSFIDTNWKTTSRWETTQQQNGIVWYRGGFTLPDHAGWIIPQRMHIESTGNLQVWLNGRLLGRYFAEGPQRDFDLPDGWLKANGKNTVAFVLRPTGSGKVVATIKSAYVAPYDEYVVQKHDMEVRFK